MTELIKPKQIKQLHVLLNATGQTAYKQDLMDMVCVDGRYPTSSKDLYEVEAKSLISWLQTMQEKQINTCNQMRRKIISCLREVGFNKCGVADMERIYQWTLNYGYLKKPLNDYSHDELPKLVTQAEAVRDSHLIALKSKNGKAKTTKH